jgi:hypothetical protein
MATAAWTGHTRKDYEKRSILRRHQSRTILLVLELLVSHNVLEAAAHAPEGSYNLGRNQEPSNSNDHEEGVFDHPPQTFIDPIVESLERISLVGVEDRHHD